MSNTMKVAKIQLGAPYAYVYDDETRKDIFRQTLLNPNACNLILKRAHKMGYEVPQIRICPSRKHLVIFS